jgi:geranylgeranyl transferase type-2 subunit alpha
MHGRKRDEYKAIHRDPNTVRKLSTKAIAWHTLQNELLQRQKQDVSGIAASINDNDNVTETSREPNAGGADFTDTTLVLLEKAVTVNPDPIWLWNFRRTLVEKQLVSRSVLLQQIMSIFDKEHEISQFGLQNNPKAYAVWHYRKWCIQKQIWMAIPFSKSGTENVLSSDVVVQLLEQELLLCNLLLQKDERNFHCWSYRRFVISCYMFSNENDNTNLPSTTSMTGEWNLPDNDGEDHIGIGAQITLRNISSIPSPDSIEEPHTHTTATSSSWIIQQEWDFTTKKIYENFSNFSAFHYRSKLLPLMIHIRRCDAATSTHSSRNMDVVSTTSDSDARDDHEKTVTFQMIHDEFELITNAIYTEPDDQTAWWYQVFLFHYISNNVLHRKDINAELLVTKYNSQIMQPHLQQVRELINETDNNSKWVLIGLLQCLQFVKKYHVLIAATDDSIDAEGINQERRTILQTLIQIDPDRKERYKYKLQQIH